MNDTEQEEAERVRRQVAAVRAMDPLEAREILAETVQALLCAVADLDAVPEDLHPADVVSKHLQRGNMEGDGVDIVPRGRTMLVERLIARLDLELSAADDPGTSAWALASAVQDALETYKALVVRGCG